MRYIYSHPPAYAADFRDSAVIVRRRYRFVTNGKDYCCCDALDKQKYISSTDCVPRLFLYNTIYAVCYSEKRTTRGAHDVRSYATCAIYHTRLRRYCYLQQQNSNTQTSRPAIVRTRLSLWFIADENHTEARARSELQVWATVTCRFPWPRQHYRSEYASPFPRDFHDGRSRGSRVYDIEK